MEELRRNLKTWGILAGPWDEMNMMISRMPLAPPYTTVIFKTYYTFITPPPGFSVFAILICFTKFNWKVRKFIRPNSHVLRRLSSFNLSDYRRRWIVLKPYTILALLHLPIRIRIVKFRFISWACGCVMYTRKVEGSDFLTNNYKNSNKNMVKVSYNSIEHYLQGKNLSYLTLN